MRLPTKNTACEMFCSNMASSCGNSIQHVFHVAIHTRCEFIDDVRGNNLRDCMNMLILGLSEEHHAGTCVTDGFFGTVRLFFPDQYIAGHQTPGTTVPRICFFQGFPVTPWLIFVCVIAETTILRRYRWCTMILTTFPLAKGGSWWKKPCQEKTQI